MTNRRRSGIAAVLAATLITAATSGCGWRGLNSLPLPGTEGDGPGAFTIQAQMADVNNLQPNSRVRVGDVNVGTVTKIERQDWHALLTLRLNGNVNLPANTTISLGQTSLLGSLHIELAPPTDATPAGKLHRGSLIPLSAGHAYPSTEETLSAASMLLNNGGIEHIDSITNALSTAFDGRENDLRSLLAQLDTFIGHVNDQTDDIINATDSLNRLVGQFAEQKPVIDKGIDTIPDALAVLNRQREHLIEAVDLLGKFSALAADSVNKTKESLVAELKDLGPVLQSLADSGRSLTHSLNQFTSFPFAQDTLDKWWRGDYANISLVVDLTLSRLDSSFFTGTRWEGNLTELEMQWGRTIGQLPSPYTQANPLLAPYHYDQGP
jgi:phospholipid/cholesterol/gamma-HCH transport system substrate-binding protein